MTILADPPIASEPLEGLLTALWGRAESGRVYIEHRGPRAARYGRL
ncbi:hypothetical protein BH20ACT2_BH20ACT2_22080 [soil metagenome]